MNNLNTYIEQTLLRPDAVEADFIKLFEEAREHKFFGVCINPNYVELAKKHLDGTGVKIVTVVGFPLGANKPEIKSCETAYAVLDGADEIDMVINIGALKAGEEEVVINDIKEVKNACKDKALKVIIETDLLTQDEIRKACELCVEAGADFVKTSTGFVKNGAGAKPEDVALMHEIVSPHGLQVKASGGIRDKEKALKLIASGATRLGTSAGAAIVS